MHSCCFMYLQEDGVTTSEVLVLQPCVAAARCGVIVYTAVEKAIKIPP